MGEFKFIDGGIEGACPSVAGEPYAWVASFEPGEGAPCAGSEESDGCEFGRFESGLGFNSDDGLIFGGGEERPLGSGGIED